MNGAEGASPNLLFDNVLIDTMFCNAVILACDIFGACIERFLRRLDQKLHVVSSRMDLP